MHKQYLHRNIDNSQHKKQWKFEKFCHDHNDNLPTSGSSDFLWLIFNDFFVLGLSLGMRKFIHDLLMLICFTKQAMFSRVFFSAS